MSKDKILRIYASINLILFKWFNEQLHLIIINFKKKKIAVFGFQNNCPIYKTNSKWEIAHNNKID